MLRFPYRAFSQQTDLEVAFLLKNNSLEVGSDIHPNVRRNIWLF